jgi:hypothetical protein
VVFREVFRKYPVSRFLHEDARARHLARKASCSASSSNVATPSWSEVEALGSLQETFSQNEGSIESLVGPYTQEYDPLIFGTVNCI